MALLALRGRQREGSQGLGSQPHDCSAPILLLCPQMLSCLEHMYHDLGLVRDFSINPVTLRRWLVSVKPAFGSSWARGFIQFHRNGGNGSPGYLPDGTALPVSRDNIPRALCEDAQPVSVLPSTKTFTPKLLL